MSEVDRFSFTGSWPDCQVQADCRGRRLNGAEGCLAHATAEERAVALKRITDGGRLDVGTGVRFTKELFAELLNALPRNEANERVLRHADFREAYFEGDAQFGGVRFEGDALFVGAHFDRSAIFSNAHFEGDAWFIGAQFLGNAWFGWINLETAAIIGPLLVSGRLTLLGSVFARPLQLEVAASELFCLGCRFLAGGHVRVVGAEISLEEAEIPVPLVISGDTLRPYPVGLREQMVILALDLPRAKPSWWENTVGPEVALRRPHLISVQNADVSGLVCTDIDLSMCHFAGAHHLDQLRVSGADTFHTVRTNRFGASRQVLAEECAWRRRQYPGRRYWADTSSLSGSTMLNKETGQLPSPSVLAGIYRQLRKGREDAKNEPGAAEFYYGEMEMRRAAASKRSMEWWLLSAYWLVAGYALRAARAFACLVLLVAVVTMLLALWGMPTKPPPVSATATITGSPPTQSARVTLPRPASPQPPTVALRERLEDSARVELAFRTALAAVLFHDTRQQLTTAGTYFQMAARLLGPILLGLTLLSIRNSVKR